MERGNAPRIVEKKREKLVFAVLLGENGVWGNYNRDSI